ncbi:flippase-like domain-containing protein [Streptomyces griseorubiginosus]|nr:flippase-like domain-containing protein [Streptomyces griseorubiginosus]WUB51670.1 flippase-like domain-containing protein [Streptomyces griseorubiginosus]
MSVETVRPSLPVRRPAEPAESRPVSDRARRLRAEVVRTRDEVLTARAEALVARAQILETAGQPAQDLRDAAVSRDRIGVIVTEARPFPEQPPRWRTALRAVLNSRALRTHFGTVAGVTILALLLWRLGTGVFLDGLRRIDTVALLAALAIGALTTVFSAWRWQLVARGLRIRLPLGPAVADYYRALFLNAALPGGVLGDVHRAVRHGQSAGDMGRGVRAVVLERAAGQIALAIVGGAVLLTMPSPVLADARHLAPAVGLATLGALAVVVALRMNRAPSSRRGRALRATLAEAREALLSRRNWPGVTLSSALVLAGHLGMFVLAARIAGSDASVAALLPLAVLALLAMGLPLNIGGFGPREGVTAWAFAATGLGAEAGLATAIVYGVLSFVASLPGAAVLVVRWYQGLRRPATSYSAPESAPVADSVPVPDSVSIEKYVPKEAARLSSNAFPFSAEPSEGRPMTPESV